MKIPAVAIAAAFATGIAAGLSSRVFASPSVILIYLCLAFLLAVGALFFLWRGKLLAAWCTSLLCWCALGAAGGSLANQSLPADHINSLVESGAIELTTPLRWHGLLRDEPTSLPWGQGMEIEISSVEYQGELRAARAGMRLTFSRHDGDAPLAELHAGDEIAVLTEAHRPQMFRDEGAFDRRAYLAREGVDLVATLRAPSLIERIAPAKPSVWNLVARTRSAARRKIDELFVGAPLAGGVLRAMLLGDRSFVDRRESTNFQKTGVFHVLVVAGLHVGALAAFLFWAGRKLRMRREWLAGLSLVVLLGYVEIVEQRPPVLRAALMAAIVVLGGFFYRRLELLNSAGIAALILLVAKPGALADSSFQLSFLAIACIAGVAVPWLERTAQPYLHALRGWRDVTRDAAHEPHAAQFRIDLRSLAGWLASRVPQRIGTLAGDGVVTGVALSFRIWELLVLSVALQIGMLPLMARDFHRITLMGPLANLVAVPLTGVIVPLGFFTLAAGAVLPFAGKLLAAPLAWLTMLLMRAMDWFVHFPTMSYRIPGPPLWVTTLFFLGALAAAACLRWQIRGRTLAAWVAVTTVVLAAVITARHPFAPRWNPGKLELSVLDVGQGDSLLVVSPGGRTMLIDGGGAFGGFRGHEEYRGPDPGEDAVSPYLWWRGYKKIDVVAVTHAHQDHIAGLAAVVENFHVGSLWIGREVSGTALAHLEQEARDKKIPIIREFRGDRFARDGAEGAILWPPKPSEEEAASPAKNNDSLVMKLTFGGESLLLPGDAERDAERSILGEAEDGALHADVLKVGHHGSKNSTTPEFLSAVAPAIAVISAGEDNPYGHPSPELLRRLSDADVPIVRTDREGAVHILTDGKRLEISCFVPCPAAQAALSTRQERDRPAPQQTKQDK